jgi:hypothetical protein
MDTTNVIIKSDMKSTSPYLVQSAEKPVSTREASEGSVCPVDTAAKRLANRRWELLKSMASERGSRATIKASGQAIEWMSGDFY